MWAIDADALREQVESHVTSVSVCATYERAQGMTDFKQQCLEDIDNAVAVEAEPVVHARWFEKRWTTECDWCTINHRALVCTACSVEIADGEKTPYCPYCGAKMDGGENANN